MNAGQSSFRAHWREVTGVFLKLGAVSYGGPAIMGIMQSEVQEKRAWLSKENFVEGLALVNMLPGAGATQLGIFLGHARAGWWGGALAGLCFILPALAIMLALTMLYAAYGDLPYARDIFYGLSPVVVGIFAMAVYRLGNVAVKDIKQILLAIFAAFAILASPLGIVTTLLLAGAVGVALYGSRTWGIASAFAILAVFGLILLPSSPPVSSVLPALAPAVPSSPEVADAADVGIFFFKVGAFTFGGGLTMLAFMQEQVVNQLHWLTPQQFLDGLALGQLTPGPILMVAAFVGHKVAGFWGAMVGGLAIFLPSFIFMLSLLPVFERIKRITWMKAALKGISPAVIGMIAVALLQMLPHAVMDIPTGLLVVATVAILSLWRFGPLPLMAVGGTVGMLLNSG